MPSRVRKRNVTYQTFLNSFKEKKRNYDVNAPKEIQEEITEKSQKKENQTMTKTMHITGMMCGHCEARVKKTLEAIDGVTEAVVSHEAGTAVVTLASDVADETLKDAVEAQDYPVTWTQQKHYKVL